MAEHGAYLAFDVYPSDDPRNGTLLARFTAADFLPGTSYRHAVPTGSGKLVIHSDHEDADAVAAGNYVRVIDLNLDEVIGGFWLEDGEQTVLSEKAQVGELRELGGPSTSYYLHRAVFPYTLKSLVDESLELHQSQIYMTGSLTFTGPETYGGVAGRIIYEARLDIPSAIPDAPAHDWDDVDDSGGTAWAVFDGEYSVRYGDNIYDLLAAISAKGVDWWLDPHTFTPVAYLQGTYGTDRTSSSFASGKVRFEAGVNIAADLKRAIYRLPYISHMLVIGDEPAAPTVAVDPDWSSGDEVRWSSLRIDNTHDETILNEAGQEAIRNRKLQEDQASFPIRYGTDVGTGHYIPGPPGSGGHFWWHDLVTLHTGSGEHDYDETPIRVEAIEWNLRSTGDFQVSVELGAQYIDPVTAAEVRQLTTIAEGGCDCGICLETVELEGGESVTVEDHLTWESGQEYWSNPYGGTGQVGTQSSFYGGASGSYAGNLGAGVSTSNARTVVPGTVLRISGYVAGYGESWPCTVHGIVNVVWGVAFYNSSDVLISNHVIGDHTQAQDSGFVNGLDTLTVTVPGGAAYMKLTQGIGPGGCYQGTTHIDEVIVSSVTTTGTTVGTDEYTGEATCAARSDHAHHASEILDLELPDTDDFATDAELAAAIAAAVAPLQDASEVSALITAALAAYTPTMWRALVVDGFDSLVWEGDDLVWEWSS